ncbi:uncharacterized protein [Procambarus clarkii]|uniref:uncharacterized protein isoform X2 n=1 Tax=Procambarus clarkii TaxID=6728 RepID=UPI003742BECF
MSFTELEYVSLAPEDLDNTSHLLVNHFYTRNIITFLLGMSPESKMAMDLNDIRTCLAAGLSVGARDKSTRQLVGVLMNSILTPGSGVIQTSSESVETEMSVNIGIKEGCTLASAAVINPHSERAFLHIGYKVDKTLDLNTVGEGLLDLSHVSHKVFKVMTKVLSPITTSS